MNVLEHPAITEPTHANIIDLLEAKYAEVSQFHVPLLTPEQFCPEEAVSQVTAAHAWWPRQCPANMSWAHNFGGSLAMYAGQRNTDPLLVHLGHAANRVANWLRLEGRDVERPNEDRAERMRRRNRERVAAHRQGQRDAGPDERPAASVAWDKVVELRRQRAVARAQHDVDVREAHQTMVRLSELRRTVMSEWDEKVAEAEAEHRALRITPAS